ncbi:MAG: AbrB/MazE/SpoVT family DNA-binding domain-containing protein [Thermoproteales archaeon]|nr:AbrB/MazE/SpoVT family DNA-binding domain-containing protein [Thermoproteales archaeon]
MKIVKVTRKGQVTIPKKLRKVLNIKEGDLLRVEEKDGRIVFSKLDIPEPRDPVGKGEYEKIIESLEEVRKMWR